MKTTRIPRNASEFRDYVNNTTDYLAAFIGGVQNFARLGLTGQNFADWSAKRNFLVTDLYLRYSNENTRTTTIVHEMANFMDNFRTFANPLLKQMASSPNATEADETVFNFKIGRAEPVRPTAPIEEDCIVSVIAKGQGTLKISCKSTEDSSRASVPEDANALELRYFIGDSAPANVNECVLSEISSRASFTFNVGAQHAGKKVFIYARWIDITNKARAGAFSEMVSIVIG